MRYYVVRKGRNVGIFNTWLECKQQVHGYSRAEFKGFDDYEAATKYLRGAKNSYIKKQAKGIKSVDAYVDGSYNNETLKAGYGCVILVDNRMLVELQGDIQLTAQNNPRNVAGEVTAAIEAIKWAVANNYKNLTIFYDYLGIENWITGVWDAKSVVSINYVKQYNRLKNNISIDFEKIKAHSGDVNNDRADLLAKQAIGLK